MVYNQLLQKLIVLAYKMDMYRPQGVSNSQDNCREYFFTGSCNTILNHYVSLYIINMKH